MKRAACALALVAIAVAIGQGRAHADRVDEAWRRGNEAYLHGDYAGAVAAYEEVDRQGPASADVAFNLGDAYFHKGAIGPSIWAFERALALDPNDDDARYNLDKARKLAVRRAHDRQDRMDGEDRDPLWMRLVAGVAPSTVTWVFAALYLGFFAALIARRWARSEWRPALTAGTAVLAAGALLTGVLLAARVHLDRIPFGVLLPDEVAVKEGADTNYRTSFDAHAGLRVRIVDHDQDWLRVRLANGLEGWVRGQDVGRI
ncbi:MAG TPA: SH3 domain-containing protein [Polyangia bacterium]|nr:SH3 domain-containing protein [Polyangia bacterium]